jgi:Mn-dependent DtxR family transcriptional regulator
VVPGTATTMVKTLAESASCTTSRIGAYTDRRREKLAACAATHRLIELFLVKISHELGGCADEAERLKHAVPTLIDRIDVISAVPRSAR